MILLDNEFRQKPNVLEIFKISKTFFHTKKAVYTEGSYSVKNL